VPESSPGPFGSLPWWRSTPKRSQRRPRVSDDRSRELSPPSAVTHQSWEAVPRDFLVRNLPTCGCNLQISLGFVRIRALAPGKTLVTTHVGISYERNLPGTAVAPNLLSGVQPWWLTGSPPWRSNARDLEGHQGRDVSHQLSQWKVFPQDSMKESSPLEEIRVHENKFLLEEEGTLSWGSGVYTISLFSFCFLGRRWTPKKTKRKRKLWCTHGCLTLRDEFSRQSID